MKSSAILVLNTGATYARSLLAVGLALFSSRWVLSALGEVDYGLFALVGSVLLFVAYLNSVLSGASSRHFAYAIGQGDSMEVNRWFNAALSIHLCFALFLTVIGWLCSEYVVFKVLNIQLERQSVCLLVFRVSLISLFSGMLSVPFVAIFRAKQNIVELSLWNTLQTVLSFCLAWYLLDAPGDRLIVYAVGMTSILLFFHACQIVRALARFQECRIKPLLWFERSKVKEIFSFAVWNMIGTSGLIFRNEGSAVLLNIYFGPTINAAYGITKRVATQVDQLAAAMLGAISPEITTREGRGEREAMIRLSLQASKFGTLLILIFLVPLVVDMKYVLELWLINPPAHTVTFCRLILIAYLIDRMSTGVMLAINANGKIAAYQATVGMTLLLTLPLAWLFLFLGFAPTSVGVAFVITMALVSMGRVLWANRLLNISVRDWLNVVALPCVVVGLASTCAALLPLSFMSADFSRLLLVSAVSTTVYFILTWTLALDYRERIFLRESVMKIMMKTKARLSF